MKINMGSADRIIRTVAAVVIALLLLTGQVTGVGAILLSILAVMFLATSVVRFCPIYAPFKVSTGQKAPSQAK